MSNTVAFNSRRGTAATAALCEPSGSGKVPALVLVQEWWGLNPHIHSLLERLADEGFLALAPDLYHGTVATSADEAGKLMTALDSLLAVDELAGAARLALAHPRCNGKVGVLGFCMGGALAFRAACDVPEFSAVVPFYGVPQNVDYSRVAAPILAHFSTRDQWAKPELAQQIQKQLAAQGKEMTLELYDAEHAFVNDTRPEVYDAEAAKLAWTRSMRFLHEKLG